MSDSYSEMEHASTRFAVEDAERDLLSMVMRSPEMLEVVTTNVGVSAAMMRDLRHRALFALLLDLQARGEFTGDFTEIAVGVAQLRATPQVPVDLAAAGDLDGEMLFDLWSYEPPARHTIELTCDFLLSADRERSRDETIEACIAALAHGSDPTQVLAHLRAAIEPTSTPGPDTASAILSIPTNKEQQ